MNPKKIKAIVALVVTLIIKLLVYFEIIENYVVKVPFMPSVSLFAVATIITGYWLSRGFFASRTKLLSRYSLAVAFILCVVVVLIESENLEGVIPLLSIIVLLCVGSVLAYVPDFFHQSKDKK